MFALTLTSCGDGDGGTTPPPAGGGGGAGGITYTVTQIGGTSNAADSTGIQFTFSGNISGMGITAADITVGGNAAKVQETTFTPSGSWQLSPITVSGAGIATVKIAKAGIDAAQRNVTVYKVGQSPLMFWWGNYIPTDTQSADIIASKPVNINHLFDYRDTEREMKNTTGIIWATEKKNSEEAVKETKTITYQSTLGYVYFISPYSYGDVVVKNSSGSEVTSTWSRSSLVGYFDGVPYYTFRIFNPSLTNTETVTYTFEFPNQ